MHVDGNGTKVTSSDKILGTVCYFVHLKREYPFFASKSLPLQCCISLKKKAMSPKWYLKLQHYLCGGFYLIAVVTDCHAICLLNEVSQVPLSSIVLSIMC